MTTATRPTIQTLLITATLLIVGIMACPNSAWEDSNAARELERMHRRLVADAPAEPTAPNELNVFVRRRDGGPAPGVAVRIFDTARQGYAGIWGVAGQSRELYQGVTGADGRCVNTIQLPESQQHFAIEWRASASSPNSARTIVDRSELTQLELQLTRP